MSWFFYNIYITASYFFYMLEVIYIYPNFWIIKHNLEKKFTTLQPQQQPATGQTRAGSVSSKPLHLRKLSAHRLSTKLQPLEMGLPMQTQNNGPSNCKLSLHWILSVAKNSPSSRCTLLQIRWSATLLPFNCNKASQIFSTCRRVFSVTFFQQHTRPLLPL